MKTFTVLVLSLFLSFASIQKSEAAAGGLAAIVGAPSAGASLAVAGLATIGGGYLLTVASSASDGCDGGACVVYLALGVVFGAMLLDEAGEVQLSELKLADASEMGISPSEMRAYNSEIEEVNAVFSEVSSQLSEGATIEDSKELWSEYKEYISAEAFSVLQKIAEQK